MTNQQIKQAGYKAVVEYESNNERECEKTERCGTDYISRKNGRIVRRIEVKSTLKSSLNFRWLEKNEFDALKKHNNFYLYLVTNAGSQNPKVWPYTQRQILQKKPKRTVKYSIKFKKSEFEN